MSFPTSKGEFKLIDSQFFGLIRSIMKQSRMPHFRQNYNFSKKVWQRAINSVVVILALNINLNLNILL